ncbi:MAG: WG repeat-containing protein [Flavobacteriales bacterium]|nr:WG repeat-containing protein [Flavobacteriales bacterium]MCB9194119.1 WG repeat-containing protein [Flavobacteriales bacterium]
MRTTILPLLLTMMLSTGTQAQSLLAQAKPDGSDLWGYINEKGEQVIAPAFKSCFRFTESGYAAVSDPNTKEDYFINARGERLKTEINGFEHMSGLGGGDQQGFHFGLAAVKMGKKWGFMNISGKLTIPAKYDKVDAFEGPFTTVGIGKQLFVLGTDGQEAAVKDPTVVDVRSFHEGLAPFKTSGKMMGFMDGQQNTVIPAQFKTVGYFSDGLAWAKNASDAVGFINKKGEWVIPAKYDAAGDMDPESGMARVKSGDMWMYVDRSGKEMSVAATSYGQFSEGLCDGKQGDVAGFFDKTGHWVIEPKFEAVRDFKNGLAAARQGGMWGFIDKTGKWVIEPRYDAVKDFARTAP